MAERMEVRLKEFIRESMPKLKEETICNDNLLDRMVSCGLFTTYDKEEIKSEHTLDSQKSEFYTKLTQKSKESYTKTIETLKACGQETAAGILEVGLQENLHGSRQRGKVEAHVWFNVEFVVKSFTGRENELNTLHELVTKQPTNQLSVISQTSTVVVGLGGIGKSQLARKYAWEYRIYFDGNAIWINSETRESFRGSMARLHEKYFSATNLNSFTDTELIQIVYDHFSSRYEKCLIILDNVSVEEFDTLELFPKQLNTASAIIPNVLITSRKTNWRGSRVKNGFRLDALNFQDATKLIEECTSNEQVVEPEDIKVFAKTLQCLPLALQQATAYIRAVLSQYPRPIKRYLELFEDREKCRALLDYKNADLSENEKTTFRTWAITLETIEKKNNGPLAIKIMNILTLYDSAKDIPATALGGSELKNETLSIETYSENYSSPTETVSNGMDYSRNCADEAITLLKSYSMISGTVGWINVHRLVQRVAKLNIEGTTTTVLKDALKLLLNSLINQQKFPNYMIPYAMLIWREALGHEEVIKQYADFPLLICQSMPKKNNAKKKLLRDSIRNSVRDSIIQLERTLGRNNRSTIRLKYNYAKVLNTGKHNRRELLNVLEEIKSPATSAFGETHDLIERILEFIFRNKEKEMLQ